MYVRLRWRNTQFTANSVFFADGKDRFRDFTNFDPITERFIAYRYDSGVRIEVGYPTIGYPAPMMCGYLLFTRVFPMPLHAYLAFIVISVTLGATCLALALSGSSTHRLPLLGVLALSVILSYPLMCLLERANMEGFIWAVLALGFTAFVVRHHMAAGLLFALAASMKLFPGVLLLLLLARKRYKEFALSVVAVAVFTVISLRLLGPSLSTEIAEVRAGMKQMTATYYMAYRRVEIQYDHSLFALLKQFLYLHYRRDTPALNNKIRAAGLPYLALAITGFATLYWFRIRKLPLLNQAIALIVLAVILPYMSGEYTLNHLFFAGALFLLFLARDVATERESISWPAARVMLACFAFIFALGPFGRIAGQLKTCALMVLLLSVLIVPMRSSVLDGEKQP
jgi:hypothetical protein